MIASRRTVIAGIAALGVPWNSKARAEPLGDTAQWVADTAKGSNLPGLSAVVARGGDTVAAYHYGHASLPFGVAVSARTRFHIASISKHLTAALILRLVEAGKVALDAPLGTYLENLPQGWDRPTIAMLLNHTSGIPDYESRIDQSRTYDHQQFLDFAAQVPLDFAPGEGWSYSNTAYVLLGWIAERITGQSYADLLRHDFLDPGGMPDARVDNSEEIISDRAEPYARSGKLWRHAARQSGDLSGWPDGSLLMSARDVAPWNAFLDNDAYLSRAMRHMALEPARMSSGRTFPYGFGWSLDSLPGGRDFHWHAGSVPGFTSFALRIPSARIAVMVLTNIDGHSQPQRWIALNLAERFAPGSTPLSLAPIPDRDARATEAARAIIFRGKGGKLDPAIFAPELRRLIAGSTGERAVINLGEPPADLVFSLVQEESDGGVLLRRYRIGTTKNTNHFMFGYTADGLIFMTRLL